eukprot:m.196455 g.196455  ORF g.196455 m.196455 type:complete len:81 (+) comp18326_c0_seq3:1256-1498(+)
MQNAAKAKMSNSTRTPTTASPTLYTQTDKQKDVATQCRAHIHTNLGTHPLHAHAHRPTNSFFWNQHPSQTTELKDRRLTV